MISGFLLIWMFILYYKIIIFEQNNHELNHYCTVLGWLFLMAVCKHKMIQRLTSAQSSECPGHRSTSGLRGYRASCWGHTHSGGSVEARGGVLKVSTRWFGWVPLRAWSAGRTTGTGSALDARDSHSHNLHQRAPKPNARSRETHW